MRAVHLTKPLRTHKNLLENILVQIKKHRILFLQSGSVFESFGGIEYYHDDFLQLACEIYSNDSVCTLFPKRNPQSHIDTRPYRIETQPYTKMKGLEKLENRVPVRYFRKAFSLIHTFKPTLIIAGHVNMGPVAYLLSKWTKIPFFINVHGIECWGDMWPQDEWCLRRAAGIMPTSHWTKNILVRNGFSEEKIHVVHPRLATAYEKLPVPIRLRQSDTFTLLTISRLDSAEQYKGQDHVLQALARWRTRKPDAKFKYVIHGEGTDESRLKKLAAELGLLKDVEFRARVKDRGEFESTYRQADAYVMPSRFGKWEGRWRGEGFGIVYLEAASYGLPLVAYGCGGGTDIIQHGINGLLAAPDNIDELSQYLELLAENPALRLSLGTKAHEVVMEKFCRPAIRQEMITALNRI